MKQEQFTHKHNLLPPDPYTYISENLRYRNNYVSLFLNKNKTFFMRNYL